MQASFHLRLLQFERQQDVEHLSTFPLIPGFCSSAEVCNYCTAGAHCTTWFLQIFKCVRQDTPTPSSAPLSTASRLPQKHHHTIFKILTRAKNRWFVQDLEDRHWSPTSDSEKTHCVSVKMYMQWINKSIFEQKTSGFLTAEIHRDGF